MLSQQITMPGYREYEYLLVLNPNEVLRERIVAMRKAFAGAYSLPSGAMGRPNLPLARFKAPAMMEQRIAGRLRMIAMGYPPFKVELKDFGSFPSHTIYINVTTKIPVQGLVKSVRKETQRLMTTNGETKPYFVMEPYISIGSRLKPWQYEKGWLEYSQKHFSGRFIADGMLLLKRDNYQSPWMIVERFELQNLPVATRQGELFR